MEASWEVGSTNLREFAGMPRHSTSVSKFSETGDSASIVYLSGKGRSAPSPDDFPISSEVKRSALLFGKISPTGDVKWTKVDTTSVEGANRSPVIGTGHWRNGKMFIIFANGLGANYDHTQGTIQVINQFTSPSARLKYQLSMDHLIIYNGQNAVFWNENGRIVGHVDSELESITDIAVSTECRVLALAGLGGLEIWRNPLNDPHRFRILPVDEGSFISVAHLMFSKDSNTLFVLTNGLGAKNEARIHISPLYAINVKSGHVRRVDIQGMRKAHYLAQSDDGKLIRVFGQSSTSTFGVDLKTRDLEEVRDFKIPVSPQTQTRTGYSHSGIYAIGMSPEFPDQDRVLRMPNLTLAGGTQ